MLLSHLPHLIHIVCLWPVLCKEGSSEKHSPSLLTWWPCSRSTTQNLSLILTQYQLWIHTPVQLRLRFSAAFCLKVQPDCPHIWQYIIMDKSGRFRINLDFSPVSFLLYDCGCLSSSLSLSCLTSKMWRTVGRTVGHPLGCCED